MISVFIYIAILALVFLLYGVYTTGWHAGYIKARKDYRQGLKLLGGGNSER